MAWLVFGVAFVVVVAVFAVAPRFAGGGRGFPWFWVVFPVTALAVGSTLMFWADFGPQVMDFFVWNLTTTAWPIVALLGAALSVWTWRTGRR
ncbi:hypothetical protein [Corynebacterium nasicanis]|uniref:Integral membrane protein n=1 Tax=Corynebacterium nasicanis TaxID=1448267 RepID=A0ABW1Q960_9CORY